MISAILAAGELHAVHVVRQKSLTKVAAMAMCQIEGDAGAGIYQVPEWAFDSRPKYGETPVCLKCAAAIRAVNTPPATTDAPKPGGHPDENS